MAFVVTIPLLVLFFLTNSAQSTSQTLLFPCLFIFGDSLVDSGNNNHLNTTAKANYPPYGVDFPYGPTGRFTNGLTSADFLSEMLGFDTFIPPFAAVTRGAGVTNGVNYASGSAGIRRETGERLGVRISLDEQLLHHEVTLSRFAGLYGNFSSAKEHLNNCLYYSVIGSNDYLNNYYQPDFYPTSKLYLPNEYASVLVHQYSQQLKKLYSLGARKIAVAGVGPLGCIPAVAGTNNSGSPCNEDMNRVVGLFNDGLKHLVTQLNNYLQGAQLVYISAMDLRPTELFAPGIRLLSDPCCQVNSNSGQCLSGQKPCAPRDVHFFYDLYHPSEIVNKFVATASFIDILNLI